MLFDKKKNICDERIGRQINQLNKLPSLFGRSALFLAVAFPGMQAAYAQQQDAIEEVTVTGSRVIRDGYQAPTPTTVIGEEAINAVAPINIADAVNILPSLAGSATPRTGNSGVSGGQAGTNTLNLRGLGSDRTLVLLDGARVVPQALTGAVDINQFPDTLIERVEIVTGGASAAYGSDAITGVVNFILNRNFTGVKSSVLGGVTDRGDNEQYRVSTTAGTPIANGRGHLIVSGEYGKTDGIERYNRSWYQGWKIINNADFAPGSGVPSVLVRPNVALSRAVPGALVVSGPLMGTQFVEGGATRQLNFGNVQGLHMEGGDWNETDRSQVPSLEAAVERRNIFGRASYEFTDNVEGYVQLSYADSTSEAFCCSNFFLGNLTIADDNAFLPASIVEQMVDAGVSSLTIGTTVADTNDVFQSNDRSVARYIAGLDGEIDGFGGNWNWNAYFQRGVSKVRNDVDVVDTLLFRRAIDAVRDGSGNIVCRYSLSNPGDACVPYNTLGVGMNTQAAIDYVRGHSWLDQRFQQDVVAATITGEPFSTAAGLVSVAAGVEYREESIKSTADEGAINNRYFAANFKPTVGRFDVKEVFLEAVVPLASGKQWAESLDLNGAVRVAEYSTAGTATTWKLGMTYAPNDEWIIRTTRSRDIRAPNLNELFLGGQVNTQTVRDPFRGNENVSILRPLTGNTTLGVEEADTFGIGFVYQPEFLPGFSMSADYYDIDIKDAISVIQQQEVIDRCFAGNQSLCGAITRDADGVVTQVTVQPVNLLSETAEGVDIEASYRMDLSEGMLTVRGLVTHVLSRKIDDGVDAPRELAGQGSIAEWRWMGTVGYDRGRFSTQLMGRYVSAQKIANTYIECVTGCPDPVGQARTIDRNNVSSRFYADLSIGYQIPSAGNRPDMDLFVRVDNLMDRKPPVFPSTGGNSYVDTGVNPALHDVIGRAYRAGIRINW